MHIKTYGGDLTMAEKMSWWTSVYGPPSAGHVAGNSSHPSVHPSVHLFVPVIGVASVATPLKAPWLSFTSLY